MSQLDVVGSGGFGLNKPFSDALEQGQMTSGG
jgi:hypothetical protein